MKDFLSLAQKRQSDRRYLPDPIPEASLDRILEAARLAPSACNAQPWKIIVVDETDLKNQIADSTTEKISGMNHFARQAPLLLVIVEEPGNITSKFGAFVKNKHFPLIDIGILAEHICLAAAAEGLGSCMIGWFDEKKVKSLLKIPSSRRPLLIITIGYPDGKQREKIRKDIARITSRNRY